MKDLLNEKGIYGMTVYMVSGCGQQRGRKVMYRGTEISINLLPKVKVEMVLSDSVAETILPEIMKVTRTGQVGDGKNIRVRMQRSVPRTHRRKRRGNPLIGDSIIQRRK